MNRLIEKMFVAMTATPRRCLLTIIVGGMLWLGVITLMYFVSEGRPRLPWQSPRQPLTVLSVLAMLVFGAFILGYVGFRGWKATANAKPNRPCGSMPQSKVEES